MNRSIALSLLIAAGWSFAARAQNNPQAGLDPSTMMAQMQQQFLQQFDVNKNGKLDGPEQLAAQEAMRQQGWTMGIAPGGFPGADQFSKQFDRDGDGKLNQMEAMMAQQAFQRMRNHGAGGMRGGVRGGGGGSALPQQSLPVAGPGDSKKGKVSPLVKRFDKDGDGKLSAEEKAAAQAELKKDKSKDKDDKEKPAKKAGK
jgi:hypothetical protein